MPNPIFPIPPFRGVVQKTPGRDFLSTVALFFPYLGSIPKPVTSLWSDRSSTKTILVPSLHRYLAIRLILLVSE